MESNKLYKKLNYKETYKLMRKFRELGDNEILIIDYLMQRDYAEITYSEFARMVDKDITNIRKAFLKLENLGIIYIVKKHKEDEQKSNTNPMIASFLVDGWMNILLFGDEL